MKLRIEIDETELLRILAAHINSVTGMKVNTDNFIIEVKSKQNYNSEWEEAAFRAQFTGDVK